MKLNLFKKGVETKRKRTNVTIPSGLYKRIDGLAEVISPKKNVNATMIVLLTHAVNDFEKTLKIDMEVIETEAENQDQNAVGV